MEHDHHDERPPSFWRSRYGIGWGVLAAVAAWFLWTEHRVHVLGLAPYLILLACPLMHLFMHGGHHHGSHRGHDHGRGGSAAPSSEDTSAGAERGGKS